MTAPGERTDVTAEREREIADEVVRFAERDGVRLAADSVGRSMTFLEQQGAELRAALESARAERDAERAKVQAAHDLIQSAASVLLPWVRMFQGGDKAIALLRDAVAALAAAQPTGKKE